MVRTSALFSADTRSFICEESSYRAENINILKIMCIYCQAVNENIKCKLFTRASTADSSETK